MVFLCVSLNLLWIRIVLRIKIHTWKNANLILHACRRSTKKHVEEACHGSLTRPEVNLAAKSCQTISKHNYNINNNNTKFGLRLCSSCVTFNFLKQIFFDFCQFLFERSCFSTFLCTFPRWVTTLVLLIEVCQCKQRCSGGGANWWKWGMPVRMRNKNFTFVTHNECCVYAAVCA